MLEFVEILVAVDGEQQQQEVLALEEKNQVPVKKERKPRKCVKGYVEDIVPAYSDEEFRLQFRMDRKHVKTLTSQFAESEWGPRPAAHGGGREIISAEKQILAYLWYVGHLAPNYRDVVERFDLSHDSLSKAFSRVSKFLFSLARDVIRWPSRTELRSISEGFKAKSSIPNVYGCVDVIHVRIEKPVENSEAYRNSKQYYSIQVQAVCDDSGKFTDIFLGSGSVNNVRTMKNFFIYPTLQQQCEGGYIAADYSYTLKTWCLVPYQDNGYLTEVQSDFNNKLNAARMEIKEAYRRLKQRFPIMHYIPFRRVDLIKDMIMGCFVLYNWDFRIEEYGEPAEGHEHNYNRPNDISSDDNEITLNDENVTPPKDAVILRDNVAEELTKQQNESIDETVLALSALAPEIEEHSNPSSDKNSEKSLTDDAVRLLISTYVEYFKSQTPGTKKHQLWQKVAAVFQAKGYSYTISQMINKWRTLERGYKRAVANSKTSKGRGQVTCSYQRELETALTECPEIIYSSENLGGSRLQPKIDALKAGIPFKRDRSDDSDDSEDDYDGSNTASQHCTRKQSRIEAHSNSSSSTMQDLVAQKLDEFRTTFKACAEKSAKERQLRHEDKMRLLRKLAGLPATSKGGGSDKSKGCFALL